jgi:hypothetical protein
MKLVAKINSNFLASKALTCLVLFGYGFYLLAYYDEFFSYQESVEKPLVYGALFLQIFASVTLFFDVFRRISAAVLLVNFIFILNINPLLHNVSFPFMSWLLLIFVLSEKADSRLSSFGHLSTCVLLTVTYIFSAYSKSIHPAWQDGSVIQGVLHSGYSRDFFFKDFLLGNAALAKFSGYFVIFAEFSAVLLIFGKKLRMVGNTTLIALQIVLLLTMRIPAMSLTLLAMQLLAIEPSGSKNPTYRPPAHKGK